MDYLRFYKASSEYVPNTRYCVYGADADLIMLSLLNHEPNFSILREEIVMKKNTNDGVQRMQFF